MIFDLLTKETIRVNVEVDDWEKAIRASGRLLVDTGAVEERYIQAMIDTAKEFGHYIVLIDGMALAHSRPDMGVNRICLSLITLKNPVPFGSPEHDPVSVVFALGALDHSSHLDLIQEMSALFEDEEKFMEVTKCGSPEEVIEKFRSILDQAL